MKQFHKAVLKGFLGVCALSLLATGQAGADDFNSLMNRASAGEAVDVLATSWQPVTGEINPQDMDSVVTGAIDVQAEHRALMRQIEAAGGEATVLREYKYLRVSSLRVDATALRVAKDLGNRQVYTDGLKTISLMESTDLVGARQMWRAGRRGEGQMVAVLDTGVDRDHPFLKGKVIREACFSMKSCPNGDNKMIAEGAAKPVHFHGTHVAGIIAGENEKFSGVAPGAKIIGVNVFSRSGDRFGARDRDTLAGLDYVLSLIIDEGLPVAAINMSLGGGTHHAKPCGDSIYETAGRMALQFGVAMVVAAGNEGKKSGLPSPACAESAVSVGAVDKSNKVAKFSNSAPYLDILAPGVAIMSSASAPGRKGYIKSDGTSMAAPHVAGALALMRAAHPGMDIHQMIDRLKTADLTTDPANGIATARLLVTPGQAAPEQPADPPEEQTPPPVAETEEPSQPEPAAPKPEKQEPPRDTGVISIGGDAPPAEDSSPDSGTTAIIQ